MKEAFIYTNLSGKVLTLIDQANTILAEYDRDGYVMTLRMLHYQFVSRNLFENTYKNYKRLGWALTQGRRMGLVDWDYMEDRVRSLDQITVWDDPQAILNDVVGWYHQSVWHTQEYAPEVWVEKDALIRVIGRACGELRVPSFACRGYVSLSAQYEASKRFQNYIAEGRTPVVFHMGDHDPSGLDMTRDNREQFALLTGEPVEVIRVALNIDQVTRYNPPPNFVKDRDSRTPAYVRQYGENSWELDALSPRVLNQMIRDAIRPLITRQSEWDAALKDEEENRDRLRKIADNFARIIEKIEEDDE